MIWILKYHYKENGIVRNKQIQTKIYSNKEDAKKFLIHNIPERILFDESFSVISLEAAE